MPPVPSRVFSGARFKELRKETGITGSDIARATGLTDRTLSSWVTGEKKPALESLVLVSDFMGLPLDAFLVPNEEVSRGAGA